MVGFVGDDPGPRAMGGRGNGTDNPRGSLEEDLEGTQEPACH
jgi:hypothetical protein